MIPQLEIRMSWPYNHILADDFSYDDYRKDADKVIEKHKINFGKFDRSTRLFQIAFNKNKIRIPKLIEKYSGFVWRQKYIPIYLVKMTQKPSIADPLTLKFRDEIDPMLLLVIHELTHLNLPEKMQFEVNNRICEQWVNLITRNVAINLNIDMSNPPMRNFDQALELGWDLKKKTLKNFFNDTRKQNSSDLNKPPSVKLHLRDA